MRKLIIQLLHIAFVYILFLLTTNSSFATFEINNSLNITPKTISYPNTSATVLTDINNKNVIIGNYWKEEGPWSDRAQGFLYEDDSYNIIHYPGSTTTWVYDINDNNQILGCYRNEDDAFDSEHYFFYQNGEYKQVNLSGSFNQGKLSLSAINNNGQILGSTESELFLYSTDSQNAQKLTGSANIKSCYLSLGSLAPLNSKKYTYNDGNQTVLSTFDGQNKNTLGDYEVSRLNENDHWIARKKQDYKQQVYFDGDSILPLEITFPPIPDYKNFQFADFNSINDYDQMVGHVKADLPLAFFLLDGSLKKATRFTNFFNSDSTDSNNVVAINNQNVVVGHRISNGGIFGFASDLDDKFIYIALGDSYQSGEGIGNSIDDTEEYKNLAYEPDTYTFDGGNGCHRSNYNYAKLLHDKYNISLGQEVHLIDVTCSGATIEPGNISERTVVGKSETGNFDPNSQISLALEKLTIEGYTSDDVDLITVGMGGNDAKFADIVTACLAPNLLREILRNYPNPPEQIDWLINQFASCPLMDVLINKTLDTNKAIRELPAKEEYGLKTILDTFSKAKVMHLNYPNILPQEISTGVCGGIRKEDLQYAKGKLMGVNKAINEVLVSGLHGNTRELVNVADAFGENPLCPSDDSARLANGIFQDNLTKEVQRLLNTNEKGDKKARDLIDKLVSDYNSWRSCSEIFGYSVCSLVQFNQLKTDGETLLKHLNDNISSIKANLVSPPGKEPETYRLDKVNGLFHPNAKGFAVLACHLNAALTQTSADQCLNKTSPLVDLIDHKPISNTPLPVIPKQSLPIKLGGFASGWIVQIWMQSKPVNLGSVITDENGAIDTTITLPEAGAGVHTLEFVGQTPGGIAITKQVKLIFPGQPKSDAGYSTYLCGFEANTGENYFAEQVEITYQNEVIDRLTPNEDGCVMAQIPVVGVSTQGETVDIKAKGLTSGQTVIETIEPMPSIAIGLWANSTQPGALSLIGTNIRIGSLIHSNADISVKGNGIAFSGGIEYVTSLITHRLKNLGSEPQKVAVKEFPLVWNIVDFRPGGLQAIQAAEDYHAVSQSLCIHGEWKPRIKDIPQGIIYVPCAVSIQGSNAIINTTIVAERDITIRGSELMIQPMINSHLPALITASSTKKAITINGATITIKGMIQAHDGSVMVRSSAFKNSCGIVGNTVAINGSGITIQEKVECRP